MRLKGSFSTGGPSLPQSGSDLIGMPQPVEKVYIAGKVGFVDIDAADVARQLTILESNQFRRITDTEFHHLNWKKEERLEVAPHIVRLVERFNQTSYWVSTEIVTIADQKDRANAIKKFITIAEHLRELGNYNGVMEIIGGLNSFVVSRLQNTWALVPQRFVTAFSDLNQLMESRSNYRDYRISMKERRGPVVPYLGVILRDLLFIEEGNKNYNGDPKDLVINFEKVHLIGEVLSQVRRQQEAMYPFDAIPALQNYFKSPVFMPEEYLYKASLACEANQPNPTTSSLSGSGHNSLSSFGSLNDAQSSSGSVL